MDLEERLKSFRLRASADGARDRVLGAARRARREQRIWRWTWAVAAAVFAAAIPINLHYDRPVTVPPNPRVEREAAQIAAAIRDDTILPRIRRAISPKPGPRTLEELR